MANLRGNLPLLLLEVETVWQQGDTSSTWFKCFNLRQHQWKSFLCVGATESQGFVTHYKFWTRNSISVFTCGIQNKSVIKDFGNKLQFLSHGNCLHHSTWSVMFVQTCINFKKQSLCEQEWFLFIVSGLSSQDYKCFTISGLIESLSHGAPLTWWVHQ